MPRGGTRVSERGRRASGPVAIGARLVFGALVAVFVAGLIAPPAAGANVVDGGFESGSLAGPFLPPMPYAFGYWEAETSSGRLVNPPQPVHTGSWAAVVDTMNASMGGIIIQDLDQGTTSYTFSFWVYPDAGIEGAGLMYNWDRGVTGARDQGTAVGFRTTVTGLVAWDTSVTLPPIAYGMWHRIEVVANKCTRTQNLYVDGLWWGNATASPAANVPSGNATVYFGDGSWIPNRGRFYWDDFAVTPWNCAAPPVTSLHVGAPNYTNGPTFVTSRTHLWFSAADQGGAGILRTMSRVDGASWGETAGSFVLLYEGEHDLEWYSEDRAGNVEPPRSATLIVDDTPPTTTMAPAGDTFPATASFGLSATDAASGVNRTEYRIDDGDWTTYTSAFRLPPGTHRVGFRSADHLGNVEPERTRVLAIVAETNWKPLVAVLFALALAGVGAWSSRRAPLAFGGRAPSARNAFAATALPFAVAEGVTGVVSLLTGLLSVPPIIGAGTVVDVGILVAGLTWFGVRVHRRPPSPAPHGSGR